LRFAPLLHARIAAPQTLIRAERTRARRTIRRNARNHKSLLLRIARQTKTRGVLRRRREESVNALTKR
jgi:hypothetical protein